MAQIFASPGRYIQGYKELKNIRNYIKWFGKSFFVITSIGRLETTKIIIQESFQGYDDNLVFETFNGECTKKEIDRLVNILRSAKCEGVIGVGGGKVIDTAKAVAFYAGVPIAVVPTVCSNDAPTSSSSVVYNEEGEFEDVVFFDKNPEIVLIDTHIIANAPVRLLVAGMGDALATYFEARTCVEAYRDNLAGDAGNTLMNGGSRGKATKASFTIAELCYKILLEYGVEAKISVENKVVTKALNNIIEANTLLSGIGFESNGVASAHAVYCGFTGLKGRNQLYHGEYVAFGTIVMLVLEGKSNEEIDNVINFCIDVGLPITLKDMNLEDINKDELDTVARIASDPSQTSKAEPFTVTEEEILAAILTANGIGNLYKNGGKLSR